MRHWLRSHLTYSNVMLTILAFLVLGGGSAVALSGSNTVFTDDIADDTRPASGGNPAGGLVAADLRPNSVGTSEAANNSLTGTDVNEASLNLAAGAWREVNTSGNPPFESGPYCEWGNFDTGAPTHNSAAFLRDRFGFVHLKGLVEVDHIVYPPPNPGPGCDFSMLSEDFGCADEVIFILPDGYRPARREVFATITNGALGRVNVEAATPPFCDAYYAGAVRIRAPTTESNALAWLSLDGISFRCAPSGSNGCP